MAGTVKDTIATRKVAILAADGVDDAAVTRMLSLLQASGASGKIVSSRLGFLKTSTGRDVAIDFSLLTASSVLFDAVYVPGGADSIQALMAAPEAAEFVGEAFRHCKVLAATGEGAGLLKASPWIRTNEKDSPKDTDAGMIVGSAEDIDKVADRFFKALAQHRYWARGSKRSSNPPSHRTRD
jgi:catalase